MKENFLDRPVPVFMLARAWLLPAFLVWLVFCALSVRLNQNKILRVRLGLH